MPIQQKLTPPVLLFSDFAGWGVEKKNWLCLSSVALQDYFILSFEGVRFLAEAQISLVKFILISKRLKMVSVLF